MRPNHRDVVLPIYSILPAERLDALNNTRADRRVAGDSVQHDVQEPVRGLGHVAHNEGARVQALSEARAFLVQVRIAHEGDLDDGARDVALACAEEVLVRREGGGCEEEEEEPKHGACSEVGESERE